MKEHGCVCVRLHEKLVAPVNVFVEAGASASAFFKLKGDMKAKHKPIGGYDPPAQSGYHTRTGFITRGTRAPSPFAGAVHRASGRTRRTSSASSSRTSTRQTFRGQT